MLEDGQVISGIIQKRENQNVVIYDSLAKTVTVDEGRIEEERISPTSIMPSGLADSLTESEFVDLIAYLEALRSGKQNMGAGITGPIQLPDGFTVTTIATGLTGAVAMDILADGRILICEQTGNLRIICDDQLQQLPVLTLPVHTEWERGLIGVTVDPNFERSPYVYVCYVTSTPYIHHVVSRFRMHGNSVVGDEERLLEGDDQSKLGGNVPAGHQGGAIHFGPDGCLYVAIGEQTAGKPSQDLNTFLGKLLRIHSDGTIPVDNPFYETVEGKYRAVWAYGLRNPFTFAFDRTTHDLLINDVGGKFEEINRGRAGANYGWPTLDHGPSDDPQYSSPIHIYPQASISGGDFAPNNSSWPAQYRGQYFFGDFVHGWIHCIDPKSADAVQFNEPKEFASGLRRPVDLRFGIDESLYVLLRNAWVFDDKFQEGTSSLLKIQYAANP